MKTLLFFATFVLATKAATSFSYSETYDVVAKSLNFSPQLNQDGLLCISELETIIDTFSSLQHKNYSQSLEGTLLTALNVLEKFDSRGSSPCLAAYKGLVEYWNQNITNGKIKENLKRRYPQILQALVLFVDSLESKDSSIIIMNTLNIIELCVVPKHSSDSRTEVRVKPIEPVQFNITKFVSEFVPVFFVVEFSFRKDIANAQMNFNPCVQNLTSLASEIQHEISLFGKRDFIGKFETLMKFKGDLENTLQFCYEQAPEGFDILKESLEKMTKRFESNPLNSLISMLLNAPAYHNTIVQGLNNFDRGEYSQLGKASKKLFKTLVVQAGPNIMLKK